MFSLFWLSGSLGGREADDPTKPISATRRSEDTRIETIPRIGGTRLTMTAETKRPALVRAAALAPFKTARVLIRAPVALNVDYSLRYLSSQVREEGTR